MGSAKSAAKRGFTAGRPTWFRAAAVCGAASLAALVFALVWFKGRVPPLPRAHFSQDEIEQAMAGLKARTAGFEPSKEEQDLVDWITRWHVAETGDLSVVSTVEEASMAAEEFQRRARSYASKESAGYLLLGDKLAVEFDSAFFRVLEEAKSLGIEKTFESGGEAAQEMVRRGGSFIKKCLERGIVGEDGSMDAPRILPQVLFRVRWRLMGGLKELEGLSRVELRAYYDFEVAYSKSASVDRRLAAVDLLGRNDASYDVVVARAVVLVDADRYEEAAQELEKASEKGRDDSVVKDFLRALPL